MIRRYSRAPVRRFTLAAGALILCTGVLIGVAATYIGSWLN